MFERLCLTCNTLFNSPRHNAQFCSDICHTEGRRQYADDLGGVSPNRGRCHLDDIDSTFADEDLDGTFLADSRLAVDGMMEVMTSGRSR